MICDWHYDCLDQTAVYFAMKGLSVVTCSWRMPANAVEQVKDLINSRIRSTPELNNRYQGVMQTIWSGLGSFTDEFYGRKVAGKESETACFKLLFDTLNNTPTP
jgi:hypothetical protein